jgi:hypothetical protein
MASGLATGLNKGHITARRELKVTPSYKKGVRIFLLFSSIGRMDGWMDEGYIDTNRNIINI